MIDVNDLDGLLELANDYVGDGLRFLTEPVSYGDLVILVERIIAAEKDAARYRLLRLELERSQGSLALFCGDSYVCDLDAFLDEEMQYNGDGK